MAGLTVRDTPHYGLVARRAAAKRERVRYMKVWIDQDLCTGDGLCEEIAPAVFTLLDDGLAYVKEDGDVKNEPGGSAGMAGVPADYAAAVLRNSLALLATLTTVDDVIGVLNDL